MKKVVLTVSAVAVSLLATAQCPWFCLLEQFTQASCGPCAGQNPGFKTNVLTPNPVKVRHIAYHSSWPGVDPMYSFNTGLSQQRVSFYGVTGVPYVVENGNQKTGSPSSYTQKDVDNTWAQSSPVKIWCTTVDNGTNVDVTVNIKSVGNPPAGAYKLYVALVERNVQYSSPPGSNGETYFPNVARVMISGNPQTLPNGNANGVTVTLPSIGNTITMGPYNYLKSWAIFNASELGAVAFIQENTSKKVIQSGATFDPVINETMTSPSPIVKNGVTAQTFNFTSGNSGASSETFTYTLTSVAPVNWSANFMVNSNTYASTATVTVNSNTALPTSITVTPGSTPAIGKFTLTMQSQTNPQAPPMTQTVYVISGITDIIVNNANGLGNGNAGDASNWQNVYVTGMNAANCTTYAITDHNVIAQAITDGAMNGVVALYFNVGWTFPAFNDNLVAQLTSYMNSGGDLFISGQDIGWDVWTTAGNGGHATPQTQAFYTNYLNSNWLNDGSTANTPMIANSADAIFGTTPQTAGNINYYGLTNGNPNYFPDELSPAGVGTPCFYFVNNTKNAGMRATNGTYKMVYVTLGIEQMTTASVGDEILKRSYNWFHGITGTQELDKAVLGLSQNYPNPSDNLTRIDLNLTRDGLFRVMDLTGRVLLEQKVAKDTRQIDVTTLNLASGLYVYSINDGTNVSTRKMQVSH